MLSDVQAAEAFCYLTTMGRRTGLPREIEIWFGAQGETLYLLAGLGERAHWVRNLRANPAVRVRIGGSTYAGRARVVEHGTEEDTAARALLLGKYRGTYGGDLSGWGRTALAVAIEVR